jgi:hypothetical protein
MASKLAAGMHPVSTQYFEPASEIYSDLTNLPGQVRRDKMTYPQIFQKIHTVCNRFNRLYPRRDTPFLQHVGAKVDSFAEYLRTQVPLCERFAREVRETVDEKKMKYQNISQKSSNDPNPNTSFDASIPSGMKTPTWAASLLSESLDEE